DSFRGRCAYVLSFRNLAKAHQDRGPVQLYVGFRGVSKPLEYFADPPEGEFGLQLKNSECHIRALSSKNRQARLRTSIRDFGAQQQVHHFFWRPVLQIVTGDLLSMLAP